MNQEPSISDSLQPAFLLQHLNEIALIKTTKNLPHDKIMFHYVLTETIPSV